MDEICFSEGPSKQAGAYLILLKGHNKCAEKRVLDKIYLNLMHQESTMFRYTKWLPLLAPLGACVGTPIGSLQQVAPLPSTLSVHLTDAPPDTDAMASVTVSIARAEVHIVGLDSAENGDPNNRDIDHDRAWKEVKIEGTSFNLLALQNDATAALGSLNLPEGKITQIRLHIDPNGLNQVVLKDGRICPLDISCLDPEGIKINHPFKALDLKNEKHTRLVIDFDLKQSIEKEGDCNYTLRRPTLKIKHVKMDDRSDDDVKRGEGIKVTDVGHPAQDGQQNVAATGSVTLGAKTDLQEQEHGIDKRPAGDQAQDDHVNGDEAEAKRTVAGHHARRMDSRMPLCMPVMGLPYQAGSMPVLGAPSTPAPAPAPVPVPVPAPAPAPTSSYLPTYTF